MSSFFEFEPPPPPLPEPAMPPRRPWAEAPRAEIGKAVAINLILGRSDKATLWIHGVTVYSDGFEFEVELRHRLQDEELGTFGQPFSLRLPPGRRRSPIEEGLDPALIRFGIQFSDGRKATNLSAWLHFPRPGGPDTPPEGPVLLAHRGGGGGRGHWQQWFWAWPLPPEGPLAFVCEWPLAAISETRTEIDSALVREPAAETVALWPNGEGGSGSGTTTQQIILDRSETPETDPMP